MRIWILTTLSIWLCALGLASIGLFIYLNIPASEQIHQLPDYSILTIGIATVAIGIRLYRGLKFALEGIPVNPPWVGHLYDFINLLFGTIGAYLFLNVCLYQLGFVPPIINDQYGLFMGVFYFAIGIPFVALYTCRLTKQNIDITKEYVQLFSLFGTKSISWEQIESIQLSDEYIAVGRVGIWMPKKLQKRLRIKSKSGQKLLINEPQIKSVKKRIIARLLEFAPEELKSKIKQAVKSW